MHRAAISPWRCWDARYSCAYGNATGHFARFLALPVPWVLAVSSGTFLVASAISGLFERYVAAAVLLVIAVVLLSGLTREGMAGLYMQGNRNI